MGVMSSGKPPQSQDLQACGPVARSRPLVTRGHIVGLVHHYPPDSQPPPPPHASDESVHFMLLFNGVPGRGARWEAVFPLQDPPPPTCSL